MAPLSPLIQRAFVSGEIAEALAMRADLALYTAALRTCRNFLVRREGGVSNRPGFVYCGEVKDSSQATLLYKWEFTAASESTLIELGDEYMRFWQDGVRQTVSGVSAWSGATNYVVGDLASSGGINYYCILAHINQAPPNATYWYALSGDIYEIPTPWTAGSFDSPRRPVFQQNGADIVITHAAYAPRLLTNGNLLGVGNPIWTLTTITTAPSISAPSGESATPGAAGGFTFRYVITAVKAETLEESLPSSVATCASAAEPTEADPVVVAWSAVTGAVEYRVYEDKYGNGVYGYIGTAKGATTFNDAGFAPDYERTPPQARSLFTTTNNFPEVSAHYQQRRLFGYTHNQPFTVWTSRTGYHTNFSIRSPLQDDDAITFTLATDKLNVIQHLVALKHLILFTNGAAWIVRGDQDGVMRPTAINLDPEQFVGASTVIPVVVGNTIIYAEARSTQIYDIRFDPQVTAANEVRDLTLLASHLIPQDQIVAMDYARVPHSIVWAVKSDGALLGLTYIRDEDRWGWHRHDTAGDGTFEDVCVLGEDVEDGVYVVVNRTIDGDTVRYIERLASRHVGALEDGIFVDSAITVAQVSSTTVAGLEHLEGAEVMCLADGLVQGPFTVTGGEIELDTAAVLIQVGLPIEADLETCDLDVQGTSLRAKKRRVQNIAAIVEESVGGFYAGPDTDHLLLQRREGWQAAGTLLSDRLEVNLTAAFTHQGRTFIRHTDPTPLTILGLVPEFEGGG